VASFASDLWLLPVLELGCFGCFLFFVFFVFCIRRD
jgi:hypothetical protein